MRERWPRFGSYVGLTLAGWLLLGILPWWAVAIVVAVDAAWSARRGDWSLVAFLTFTVGAFSVAAIGASLLF